MRARATAVLILFVMVVVWVPMYAAGPATSGLSEPGFPDQFGQKRQQDEPPKPDPEVEKQMQKARLDERYKNLKRDSERLLELATELKQYVDKSNQNVLSMEVVRKCEEIEKLAKSVRTKMKGD